MAARIAEPVSPAPLPTLPPATLPDGLPPAPPHPRPEDIRVVAFDCYGTLLDFDERGFAPAVDGLLREHGVTHTSGEAVWKAWTDHARDLAKTHGRDPDHPLAGPEPPFIPFAESWTAHFAHAFRETAVEGLPAREATDFLFDLLAQAQPYPEVVEVIDALHSGAPRGRGLKIVVASNADDAHLDPALDRCGIRGLVDAVISSEGVCSTSRAAPSSTPSPTGPASKRARCSTSATAPWPTSPAPAPPAWRRTGCAATPTPIARSGCITRPPGASPTSVPCPT